MGSAGTVPFRLRRAMVARENGAVAERVEQCIDMVAQSAIMPGHEPHQEHVPRQVLPNSPALDVLAADRAKERLARRCAARGRCLLRTAAFKIK
jgi:hypothetical protein